MTITCAIFEQTIKHTQTLASFLEKSQDADEYLPWSVTNSVVTHSFTIYFSLYVRYLIFVLFLSSSYHSNSSFLYYALTLFLNFFIIYAVVI